MNNKKKDTQARVAKKNTEKPSKVEQGDGRKDFDSAYRLSLMHSGHRKGLGFGEDGYHFIL